MKQVVQQYQLLIGIMAGSFVIGGAILIDKQFEDELANQDLRRAGIEQAGPSNSQVADPVSTSTQKEISGNSALEKKTAPDSSVTKAKAQVEWRQVASYSGVGMKNLPPFTVSGTRWRVQWSCHTVNGEFGLSVLGKSTNGGDPGSEVVRSTCPFSGVSQYAPFAGFGGPGSYYLEVIADVQSASLPGNETSWNLVIEELR